MSVAPFNFDEPEPRRMMHRVVGSIVLSIAYLAVVTALRILIR